MYEKLQTRSRYKVDEYMCVPIYRNFEDETDIFRLMHESDAWIMMIHWRFMHIDVHINIYVYIDIQNLYRLMHEYSCI